MRRRLRVDEVEIGDTVRLEHQGTGIASEAVASLGHVLGGRVEPLTRSVRQWGTKPMLRYR